MPPWFAWFGVTVLVLVLVLLAVITGSLITTRLRGSGHRKGVPPVPADQPEPTNS